MTTRPTPIEWDVAVGTGLLRIGAGAALLRWRRGLLRLAGAAPDDRMMSLLFTYFGVRDIALGIGTLAATRPGADVPRQVTVQGVADTTDGIVLGAVVAAKRLPPVRGAGVIALAVGTAVAEFAGSWQLRRRAPH